MLSSVEPDKEEEALGFTTCVLWEMSPLRKMVALIKVKMEYRCQTAL